MIKQNDILADLHMHTVASLHAYSSLSEMINASREAGYKYIAITDHLFQMQDPIQQKNETARIEYLSSRMRFEKDITVVGGAELNIGQEVIDIKKFKRAKGWLPLGLHSWFVDFDKMDINDLYQNFEKAALENNCSGFAHMERDLYKFNKEYDNLVPETKKFFENMLLLSKKTGIPVELNETSFVMEFHNPAHFIKYWLNLAKEIGGIKLYLGSDAHFYSELGKFDNCLKALNEISYPEELIINIDENKIKKHLQLEE